MGKLQPEVEAEVRGDAQDLYDRIAGTIRPPAVYILGGLLHTAFLRLFDRIVVESTEVERLRKTVQESHGPVILLPTHRSYMDSLLLFYMCLGNGMPLPFVAADENLAQIAIINRLLRNSGTFFLKKPVSLSKSQTKSPSSRLYYTVVHQYIQAVAKRHGYLEFFIEGGRSKTGLLSRPQNGILRSVLDLYFDFEQPNVTFVPITISYDKVLEADSFPQELLGGHRKKEDLRRVLNVIRCMSCYGQDCKIQGTDSNGLQQRFGLGSKPLGSAYIKIAEPTTFKLTADFADHLMGNLSSNLIVSPTSLVATILCMHRNGIREEDLEDQVQWLRDQVLLRGGLLSPGVGGLMFDMRLIVQAALQTYLRGVVASSGGGWSVIQSVAPGAAGANGVSGTPSVGDLTMKRPSTVGGTVVGPLGADAPRLVLAYYRNECCHLFILEAIVCAALFAFGHETAWEEGADSTALTEKAVFLMELLKDHFALKSQMREGEILKVSRHIRKANPDN
ncbi:acyltransferase domain-containing protein [Toxoplasma gondii TgCatPRC2]|uniref:Acyltransferase domain-containing protein n=3 Tax=Toxoplasma gondii TaxID=5811 RepID=A0A151HAW8_TOXGO|nr:acyltransferase domain-containing protein [Toxoplasma gondii ME49]EPT30112.1 acyltransferase domain-containing protein [Toxoplasma gondii ME49]KYK66465.1 acyltransferase domain-containing protein [Toxoplasma gondii TgCatPRC2]PIL99612.1 acyltransferase domain-containing protein [Toxoplasma gondii COUG]|eukprot:XP_002367639.1 acyltransferase domain-containing protein [Toxoplasma gondii ME49]